MTSFWQPRILLLVLVVGLCAFVVNPYQRDFWKPDEPVHALVARQMTERPMALVPHRGGEAYVDYGPLYFWLINFSGSVFGTAGTSYAFIPTGLTCVFTGIFMWWIAARRRGNWAGLLAVFLFAGSIGVGWEARGLMIDILLIPTTLAGLYCFSRYLTDEHPLKRHLALGFVFGCIGWLVKGPVGLALPVSGALLFTMLGGQWKRFAWLLAILIVVTAAFGAAYYGGIAYYEGKETSNAVLHAQLLDRVLPISKTEHHQPVYYFFPYLFLFYAAPWLFLIVPALVRSALAPRSIHLETRFWGAASLAIFLMYSIAGCKRQYYLLPMIAPLCLWLAGCFAFAGRDEYWWPRRLLLVSGVGIALCGIVPMVADIPIRELGSSALLTQILAILSGLFVLLLAWRAPDRALVPSLGTICIIAIWVYIALGVPQLDQVRSMRHLIQGARARVGEGPTLYAYHALTWCLKYEDSSIVILNKKEQLVDQLRQGRLYCFIRGKHLPELNDVGCKYSILVEQTPPDDSSDLFIALEPLKR